MSRFTRSAATFALTAAFALMGACAFAQSFPDKPVRMIVPLPPGTGADFLARTIGYRLADLYKQQIVVDNRPGAGGLIGSGVVARASPDGYTLAMIGPPHIVGPLLQKERPYRPLDDFAAVIEVGSVPNVIVVAPTVPAKNLRELVTLIRSKPGEFNYGTPGVGTAAHLATEILNRAAGLNVVHVPFKMIGDVMSEMIAGRVQYAVLVAPAALTILRGDAKLRALAVTSAQRSTTFPDLPTVAETGFPDAQSETWLGIVAPARTPARIIAQLNADVVTILREPDTKQKFANQAVEFVDDTTAEGFAKLLKSEYARYQKLIKDIGIKPQ